MAGKRTHTVVFGSAFGALTTCALLGIWMGMYLIGGLAVALRTPEPWGSIPNAMVTPAFYYVIYLLPALVGGLVSGGAVGVVVNAARGRPASA